MSHEASIGPLELERYDRQLRIPTFGIETQRRLKTGKVLVLGLGGTGCPAAMYLTAAGVGHIKLVEYGKVDLSNLNRQILYSEKVLGRDKSEVGADLLRSLNADIYIEEESILVTEENVAGLIQGWDFVVDCFDNIHDRLLVNRACLSANISSNHGFIHGFRGETITVIPHRGACLRCLIDDEKMVQPSLSGVGNVIGVSAGVIGILQATDAIKYLTSTGERYPGKRILVDLLDFSIQHIEQEMRKDCPHCS